MILNALKPIFLLAESFPTGQALAKLSTLIFLKLQNSCTPIFQAILRSTYKPFYGTSFFLYYAYMLEYCHMSGVGTVIDIKNVREQLSQQAKPVLAFRSFLYDAVKISIQLGSMIKSITSLQEFQMREKNESFKTINADH